MILFLDTPRADGLNHRFVVASPVNCDESEILKYSGDARESLNGADYLAVSRPVLQVSRSQVRDGRELLVLADISTHDPGPKNSLRRRLNEMLNSIPDAPIPVDDPSIGMLVPSHQIAEFERELREEFLPIAPSRNPPFQKSDRHVKSGIRGVMFVTLAVVAVFSILTWKLSHRRGGEYPTESDGGSVSPTTVKNDGTANPSKGRTRRSSTEKDEEWSFLRENEWAHLAELTGLRSGWTAKDANTWAANLLREADSNIDVVQEVTPDILKYDNNVNELLEAFRSAPINASMPDADSVSEAWIGRRGNDGRALLDFWVALREKSKEQNVSALKLRNLLATWEQALDTLKEDDEVKKSLDNGRISEVSPRHKPPTIGHLKSDILLEADLRHFRSVESFLRSDYFLGAIKDTGSGDRFEALLWQKKLMVIHDLGINREIPKPIAKFCKSLDDAVQEFRR
ncbi:MAG: hypothetical protein WCK77_21870 [Verrucomicrobiota bacterium]